MDGLLEQLESLRYFNKIQKLAQEYKNALNQHIQDIDNKVITNYTKSKPISIKTHINTQKETTTHERGSSLVYIHCLYFIYRLVLSNNNKN